MFHFRVHIAIGAIRIIRLVHPLCLNLKMFRYIKVV